MRRLVTNIVLAALAVGALQLTGCQYRSNKDTYYLVAPNLTLPYWKSLQEGFKDAAREYGVTAMVSGPDKYDPAAEADAMSSAVARHPAGILVSAADAGALRSDIDSAISAGIPVITVDSDAPNSHRLYFIGTNNLEAGHIGGQRLVERLHGKGNVVIYSITGQPNLDEREKGYRDILNDNPGVRIIGIVSTGGESNAAFDRTEELVHQTGANKVDAFVSLESSSGPAVAEVLKRNHMTDRVLIAMDVDADTLSLIQDGVMDATISQKPYTMGYMGLKALDEAHRSKHGGFRESYVTDLRTPFPAFVDTGSTLITKDNVGLFQAAATNK